MSLPLQAAGAARQTDPDLAAARSGSVLALLGHLGVLQFSGEDAGTFLQGQLSCDVAEVGLRSSSYGAYCSPKGRMLANFLLWREEAGFHMVLSRDIAPSVHDARKSEGLGCRGHDRDGRRRRAEGRPGTAGGVL